MQGCDAGSTLQRGGNNQEKAGSLKRVHACVSGTVQGVGFRYFTASHARRLHVNGWVRNRADGSVELVAEGAAEQVDRLMDSVREGPFGSSVAAVDASEEPFVGEFSRFEITG